MKIGRRGFLMAGGALATVGATLAPGPIMAAARSVAELGVKPDEDADQTETLRKAIGDIAAAGEAVYMPGGVYRIRSLKLPADSVIAGVAGMTRLMGLSREPMLQADNARSLHLFGIGFEGAAVAGSFAAFSAQGVAVAKSPGAGIAVSGARTAFVSQCRFQDCAGDGLRLTADAPAAAALVTANHFVNCATGAAVSGSGSVSGNIVAGASAFGLKLGGGDENGAISATGNTIEDCATGIGVSAGGETILASLNLILRSRDGAIRAFDGGRLLGPDLARESAEAYLNLAIIGNVAR